MDRYIVITFYSTRKRKKTNPCNLFFPYLVIKTTIPKFQMKKDWVNQIEIKPILIKKISTKFFIPSDYTEKDFIKMSLYFSPIKNANTKKHPYRNIQIIPKPDAITSIGLRYSRITIRFQTYFQLSLFKR